MGIHRTSINMNSSSIIFFFCVFAVFSASAINEEELDGLIKECEAENDSNPADKEKFDKGEEIEDVKFKCMTACVMKKVGMMNDDGTMRTEYMHELFHEKMDGDMMERLKECIQKKSEDQCVNGYETAKCLRNFGIPPKKE